MKLNMFCKTWKWHDLFYTFYLSCVLGLNLFTIYFSCFKGRGTREKEIIHLLVYSPNAPTKTICPILRSVQISSDCPCGWQGFKHLHVHNRRELESKVTLRLKHRHLTVGCPCPTTPSAQPSEFKSNWALATGFYLAY